MQTPPHLRKSSLEISEVYKYFIRVFHQFRRVFLQIL